MKPDFLTYFYPGWITNLLGSFWMVIVTGILFLGTLSTVLFTAIRKRKTPTKKSPPASKNKKKTVDYDHLITAIKKKNGRARSLLLAASSLNDLPVTVPVNAAIRLAETHKCLLVDLDTKRNAIARVFDIEPACVNGNVQAGSYPTSLENLYVWPAKNFEVHRQMNLRALLEGAGKKYDYILIYAPYLTTLPDRRQVAACSRQAIAFTGNNGTRLMKLLEHCNCKVIEEM